MSDPALTFTEVFTVTTLSPGELPMVVSKLKNYFTSRTLLLLEGPVGAGKTELVKALTRELKLPETASPSFAIHHRYQSEDASRSMDHVDLYRLESEDDLESTGFWDLFSEPTGLVVIEWSDRLNLALLPMPWTQIKVQIELATDSANQRTIKVFKGEWLQA